MTEFYVIFQCNPVAFAWDTSLGGKCLPATELANVIYAFSVMTVIADFLWVLVPVWMLWDAQMNKRMKASVILVLSLGVR